MRKSASVKEFENYDAALVFLRSRLDVEQSRPSQVDVAQVFRLDRMQALMAELDDPQATFKSVHIAGSKGKGSVCEMTAAALQACGYAVGLYTSPHLIDLTERIRLNGVQVSKQDFTTLLGRAAGAAAELPKKLGEATCFELLTAMAFLHFAEQAVDIAIIETGMGGRVDATNIIAPEVTAITAIQKEHTQILGTTLEKIAAEKAGIMKPGIPCVTVPQDDKVLAVLREHAAAIGAHVSVLGQEIDFSARMGGADPTHGPHARVCLTSKISNFEHLAVPLLGEHQAINCGLALAVIDKLRERGLETPEAKVANGLARTPARGRLELIPDGAARIYIDGAHNPESVQALVKAIGTHIRYDSMVVVFGCAADKDIPGMLTAIAMGADKIFFTRAEGSGRAADPRDLYRKFAETAGKMAQVAPNLAEAVKSAKRAVSRGDIILITGSFALAGEAKRLLKEPPGDDRATTIEAKPLKPR
jgi:dihydrofolate synthase / folylpolyglutamate synthase